MNYDWDWPASEREFKRALALDPDSTVAHQWYATYLTSQGRFDEAVAQIERARQLDPLSIIINTDAGQILLFARRYKEAEEKLTETVRLDPRFGLARIWLGCVYVEQKRYEEAMTEFKIYHEIVGEPSGWGDMGYVYAVTGKRKEAEEMLSLVEKKVDETMDRTLQLWIYIGLGRIDDAFACLEIDYRSHATDMTSLKVNPKYDSLRSDPRFADLMRRVRLLP
jgi:tetratricopeptide (TPR) repeat protein